MTKGNFIEAFEDNVDNNDKVITSHLPSTSLPQPLKSTNNFWVQIIPVSESTNIQKHWIALANQAIEPNPFYEPDYLTALVRDVCASERHWLVLVWSTIDRSKLAGLFPVTVKGVKKGFPINVTCFSFHDLIGICTPLISPEAPEEVWKCFLGFIQEHSKLPDIIHIPEFYCYGKSGQALQPLINKCLIIKKTETDFERAAAYRNSDFETYASHWSKKKARNIRSRERKLKNLGTLSFEIVEQEDVGFKGAFDIVLALEKSGWKGRRGTALVSQARTKAFVKHAFLSKNKGPVTHISLMRLDGQVIAGQLNLVSQNCAFFIKSAFDEALASYGPGVMLYKWVLEQMLDHGHYLELDSCADAGHSLEEIWLERKRVQGVFLTAATAMNKKKLRQLILWRLSSKAVLKRLKQIMHYWRKRNAKISKDRSCAKCG